MTYGDSMRDRLRLERVGPKIRNEARRLTAPLASRLTPLRQTTFTGWNDSEVPYFVHVYNTTWMNERAVEIPLALEFLDARGTGHGMEFGNVLDHYGLRGPWEVVDKYEEAAGVTPIDVVDYRTAPLDFIVSISTLEHVGWDEKPRDPDKVLVALAHLRSLLAPDGRLFVTCPLGHNETLDAAVMGDRLGPLRQMTLVRAGRGWRRSDQLELRPYAGGSSRWAGSVWVAEFDALRSS